jgi:hypothetical protein
MDSVSSKSSYNFPSFAAPVLFKSTGAGFFQRCVSFLSFPIRQITSRRIVALIVVGAIGALALRALYNRHIENKKDQVIKTAKAFPDILRDLLDQSFENRLLDETLLDYLETEITPFFKSKHPLVKPLENAFDCFMEDVRKTPKDERFGSTLRSKIRETLFDLIQKVECPTT